MKGEYNMFTKEEIEEKVSTLSEEALVCYILALQEAVRGEEWIDGYAHGYSDGYDEGKDFYY